MINMTTGNVNKIWVLLAKRKQKEGYCKAQPERTSQVLMSYNSWRSCSSADSDFNMPQGDGMLLICGLHFNDKGHKLWTISLQILIL